MGERIGYCVRDPNGRSPIFRKQWMIEPETVVKLTWDKLLTTMSFEGDEFKEVKRNVGDGSIALREDLTKSRAFAALVNTIYSPPFDSIHTDINCDINDHGLIEIDVSEYNNWKIYHIPIPYNEDDKEGDKVLYATMSEAGFKQYEDESYEL